MTQRNMNLLNVRDVSDFALLVSHLEYPWYLDLLTSEKVRTGSGLDSASDKTFRKAGLAPFLLPLVILLQKASSSA